MRKIIFGTVCLFFIFIVNGNYNIHATTTKDGIHFRDDNLRIGINQHLGQPDNHQLTETELLTLDALDLSGLKISNLSGLEYAKNLTYLNLSDNNINNLSAIKGLQKLASLYLSDNKIDDLDDLSGLSQLKILHFDNNMVDSLEGIEGLPYLLLIHGNNNLITTLGLLDNGHTYQQLHFDNNRIRTISDFSTGKVTGKFIVSRNYIDFKSNSAGDQTVMNNIICNVKVYDAQKDVYRLKFSDANLKAAIADELNVSADDDITNYMVSGITLLNADDADIYNINELAHANHLFYLSISNSQVKDFTPIHGMYFMQVLDISGNIIDDVSFVSKMEHLTVLGIADTDVSDISCLSHLNYLFGITLSGTEVSDISPISHLGATMYSLTLDQCKVSDLSPLSHLLKLNYLSLNGLEISGKLQSISGLSALKFLSLNDCDLDNQDLVPVDQLTSLTRLDISNNHHITELGNIQSLTDLTSLKFNNCSVEQLLAIDDFYSLKTLEFNDNFIRSINPLGNMTSIEVLMMNNNLIQDISTLAYMIEDNASSYNFEEIDFGRNYVNLTNRDTGIMIDDFIGDGITVNYSNQKYKEMVFEDPAVERVIRVYIGRPKGTIWTPDLFSIYAIDINGQGVVSLSDLNEMPNLMQINAADNTLDTDFDLSNCRRLNNLNLNETGITDLRDKGITEDLEWLSLKGNGMTSLENISEFEALETLIVSDNEINNILDVREFTQLEQFIAKNNKISNLHPLVSAGQLQYLDLSTNRITDITPLSILATYENTETANTIILENLVLDHNYLNANAGHNQTTIDYLENFGVAISRQGADRWIYGDFDLDGIVNGADGNALRGKYGVSIADNSYKLIYDLNKDEIIDGLDLAAFYRYSGL